MDDLSLLKRYARNHKFQFENPSWPTSIKNSKRFFARVNVGEMLFPFYFRPETDKIDKKSLTWRGERGLLKGVKIHPRPLFTLAFKREQQRSYSNNPGPSTKFHPSQKKPRGLLLSARSQPLMTDAAYLIGGCRTIDPKAKPRINCNLFVREQREFVYEIHFRKILGK